MHLKGLNIHRFDSQQLIVLNQKLRNLKLLTEKNIEIEIWNFLNWVHVRVWRIQLDVKLDF